jgi:transglutaminase-like putative cysteine protease
VAKLAVPDAQKMEILMKRAEPYIRKVDFTGHYSALETLDRRAADCTDAAVLLAALGRAAGIPTRVVNGVDYSGPPYHGYPHVFLPHSWTVAWVGGKWRSYDLALDDFDSTHIALTVGDGDQASVLAADQLAALLRWDGMTEVRTPPPN